MLSKVNTIFNVIEVDRVWRFWKGYKTTREGVFKGYVFGVTWIVSRECKEWGIPAKEVHTTLHILKKLGKVGCGEFLGSNDLRLQGMMDSSET